MTNESKPAFTAEKPDFAKLEHEVLDFWERENCFQKLLEKNQGSPPFRFLDGPITANNPMGVHHAWGRSIKDIFLRYKAMKGYSCHYRNGFDTQGLWVEVEVEKELGFKAKKDIEDYGMEQFVNKCLERITRFSRVITTQSKRLGQWMDWDNSYFTHSDGNITGIWHFLKTCHENGWIVRSKRPMPWCPRCGTSLSQHEMSGSYEEITHTAVFARVPVTDRNFEILVWTTTPWTLCANVALAVNAKLDYVIIAYESGCRPLLLAKAALKHVRGKKKVLKTLKGSELIGLSYETFFPDLAVQQNVQHKIIAWDEVSEEEGSGVVHMAPGCGAEDYILGKEHLLPEICPVDESGKFYPDYGFLGKKSTSESAPLVFAELERQGKLFKTDPYTHSYPICWRCKSEVLFRLVSEWYIKTAQVKPRLLNAVSQVKWEPEYTGRQMLDWLNNMGDWNISRKRFYGLPLPFYPCENCGHLTVVGSKEELRELADQPADEIPHLHRPWIDRLKISCPQCGSRVSRIKEVGDVWLDAGIVPFSTQGYFTDRAQWANYFPAEWVTEMREQVRLWFYSLLFMSVTLVDRAPYERVLAYSSVVAEDGSHFSKTGYMIRFDDAAKRLGADAIRYLFAGTGTGSDVRFGYKLGDEARRKMMPLWNIYTFFTTYAGIEKPTLVQGVSFDEPGILDKWLENRINAFVKTSVDAYEDYDTVAVIKAFEECCDDVSNWYIRVNRRRFWDGDKTAYTSLYRAIKTILQVMAPLIPFMTEYMWQNLVRDYERNAPLSVHLGTFPEPGPVDTRSINDTNEVRKIIAMALKLRNEKQLKVKQPLSVLYIAADQEIQAALKQVEQIAKEELNVKSIEYGSDAAQLETRYLKLNYQTAGAMLKGEMPRVKGILAHLSPREMQKALNLYNSGGDVLIDDYPTPLDRSV
ncbi:MAG: isoleucine--tRNA ligase, partial [Syntrophomonas sp.]